MLWSREIGSFGEVHVQIGEPLRNLLRDVLTSNFSNISHSFGVIPVTVKSWLVEISTMIV